MTPLERQIKIFVLKALLAANGQPMTADTLAGAITAAFQHVALTHAFVREQIAQCEQDNLIAGANDELFGLMWALTPKGKIRAKETPP